MFWATSRWWCRACLRELKPPKVMLGWLYMFNSIRIECSGREVLLIWQEKQSSCNAGMPQWHNLCTIAQIALNHSHWFSQQCGIMGTWTVIVIYAQYREQRSTSLRAASLIALHWWVARMKLVHWFLFFFHRWGWGDTCDFDPCPV